MRRVTITIEEIGTDGKTSATVSTESNTYGHGTVRKQIDDATDEVMRQWVAVDPQSSTPLHASLGRPPSGSAPAVIPAQFTVHRTRAEQDLIAMKWRRTLRRRARRTNKGTRYGAWLRRTYEDLFRENLASLERADAPPWRPWMERET